MEWTQALIPIVSSCAMTIAAIYWLFSNEKARSGDS